MVKQGPSSPRSMLAAAGLMMEIGLFFFFVMALFGGLGYLIDRFLLGSLPLLTIAGLAAGVVASFVGIRRIIKREVGI